MHALPAPELIRVWELGQGQDSTGKALILLLAACPEKTPEELAALSIGRRDAYLLQLREQNFSETLNAFAECPKCAAALEYSLNTTDLRGWAADSVEGPLLLEVDELALRLRLPDSTDLAAAARCRSVEEARREVAQRCVLEARRNAAEIDVELPDAVIARISQCLAESDPGSDLLIGLNCAVCGQIWQVVFDIASYLWAEISAQAKRLLGQVHILARAYGWRESDILAMSAVRRRFYVETVS
jgi:hypothetical protein